MIERVKIIGQQESVAGTKIYIGEKEVTNVKSVDFNVSVDTMPEFIFTVIAPPDIDAVGDVKFDFTPQTVEQAIAVLRNELLKHGDLYAGFWSSIRSAVKEQQPSLAYRNPEWIAQEILDRIIGEN